MRPFSSRTLPFLRELLQFFRLPKRIEPSWPPFARLPAEWLPDRCERRGLPSHRQGRTQRCKRESIGLREKFRTREGPRHRARVLLVSHCQSCISDGKRDGQRESPPVPFQEKLVQVDCERRHPSRNYHRCA